MKRLLCSAAALAMLTTIVADPANAQLAGNPVYAINPGVGVTLAADFGRGINDVSGKTNYLGGRVVVGVPMVSFWAGGGIWDPRGGADKQVAIAGGAAINLIKAPLLPVALSMQAGAGRVSCGTDCSSLNAVLGPSLKINVPVPAVRVEPWIMPRVSFSRTTIAGTSDSDFGIGASAGVNLKLPAGPGIHLAVDWSRVGDPSREPIVAGIGIHYTIEVPSLGVPLVPIVN